ncbi:MAG: PDZ domain-containing protein [Dehalococcoidales bacterium]|nr:PDZ domain-containing protein [Dehalococcoidales bacterium]
MKKILIILLVAVVLLTGCAKADKTQEVNPADVVKAAIEAFNSGDIEKGLSFLADDFVLLQDPPGVKIEGKAQYEAALKEAAKWDQQYLITSQYHVDGDKVSFTAEISSDEFRIIGLDSIDASFEVQVRDGKIVSITAKPNSDDWDKIIELSSGGIGVSIKYTDKGVLVEKLAENSPASEAGIRPGDIITAVDGVNYSQMREGELTLRIRGKVGTIVLLTVIHEGAANPIDIEVTRINMEQLRWQ